MVTFGGRGGVVQLPHGLGFARPTHTVYGNELPPDSGLWQSTYYGEDDKPGPSPASPGYVIGGTAGGGNDGVWGADARAPKITRPVFMPGDDPAGMDDGFGRGLDTRPSFWRGGIQGFNDKLTVKDRHVYWDQGRPQRQGTDFVPASSPPNTYNNPREEPPVAELRAVNRTWSYQKGTDTTRNQDDLTRPYTWLGEQGSGWAPIYGGTPGLYVPYGSRGGVPYPIMDPTDGEGGPEKVWAGPPHGLHSLTFPDGADTLRMYGARPQMRFVRVDRPSNSPQAGQAYSQTVQQQGGPARTPTASGSPVHHTGRGWAGGAWLA